MLIVVAQFAVGAAASPAKPLTHSHFVARESTPTQGPTTTTTRVLQNATATKPRDDKRARAAAIALLIGLAVATAWLTVTEDGGRRIANRRFVRATQNGEPLPPVAAKEWGVGRFRSAREGPPPTI